MAGVWAQSEQMAKTVIRYLGEVNEANIRALIKAVDEHRQKGEHELVLLISSSGGQVFWGLSAFNYLKGCGLKITTHNLGTVDSIAVPIFCSGTVRLSTPQAGFLIHGVSWGFAAGFLEGPQLEEVLKRLKADSDNIANVIAETTGKAVSEIEQAMVTRTMLRPEQAKEWGLVQEIKAALFEAGATVISIPAA